MWETQHNTADSDCFKTLILQETQKTRSQHHTFVPTSRMWKKQTSVSHSSAEAEIISLDAGFRMDEIPALDLWELVIEVFLLHQTKRTKPKMSESHGETCRQLQS